jgi:hypothetical protein
MVIPIAAILGGALLGGSVANMFPPLTRWAQHGMNRLWSNEIIPVNDAVEAYYRGIIDKKQFDYELESTGLNADRRDWLVALRLQLFNVVESVILWRREEITDEDLNGRLIRLGIPENDMPLWVKFTETRPSVQDVITFAVREVYSPQIAEKFGQFEGADEVATVADKDLKAAGISPETLRKYWAAHWQLPSVQMGFEMLHRAVITNDELKLLMRALDIMPFWRDKLIEISYQPLTRVDVRRMHKLGVVDDAALLKCYKDIGYNEENAQRLADFTKLYNADPETSEETKTDRDRASWKDLTKSDIVGGYSDGLFDLAEARTGLYNLGYSDDESDFLLSRADYDTEKDSVNKLISAYHTAYIGNTMSYNEIIDKLSALNLTGKRIENLFNVWDIERSVRTQKPTKAEILSFLRQGIIDKETAVSELLGMGYPQRYVDWYMQTVKA